MSPKTGAAPLGQDSGVKVNIVNSALCTWCNIIRVQTDMDYIPAPAPPLSIYMWADCHKSQPLDRYTPAPAASPVISNFTSTRKHHLAQHPETCLLSLIFLIMSEERPCCNASPVFTLTRGTWMETCDSTQWCLLWRSRRQIVKLSQTC